MYEINTKTTNPQNYLYIRRYASTQNVLQVMGSALKELFDYLEQQNSKSVGYTFGIYPDLEFNPIDFRADSCVPVAQEFVETDDIKNGFLPEQKVAYTIHKGSYADIQYAYQAVFTWIRENSYEIIGSPREIYVIGAFDTQNSSEYHTEVIFPIK